MPGFSHVLCPVDFSDTSRRALQYAAALAAWYEARLTVLHVMRPEGDVPIGAGLGEGAVALPAPTAEQVLSHLAREVAALDTAPADPALRIASGPPHQQVLEQIAALGADLLVIGTHGRSGFQRLFLGSVTEKLLRTAPCPVLTVSPGSSPGRQPVLFKQILCPTDFSPTAARAVAVALDLGRQADGCVTLLHAIEYLDPEAAEEPMDVQVRAYRERLIDQFRQRLHAQAEGEPQTWCEIREVLAVNRAYREILDRAAAMPADLIVMGAQGHGGVELMFYGSTTQHVVRRATCPVLTVRAS